MRIGLREASQRLSKAIRAVKAGEEVILTERGRPIAVIRPLPQADDLTARVERMVAAGLLRPALKGGPMPPWKPPRAKRGATPLSRTLREERDER